MEKPTFKTDGGDVYDAMREAGATEEQIKKYDRDRRFARSALHQRRVNKTSQKKKRLAKRKRVQQSRRRNR